MSPKPIALTFAALLASGPAMAAMTAVEQWPSYRLQAVIDPPAHQLRMTADVALPAGETGQTVEFVLGGNFTVTASAPAAEKLDIDAAKQAFAGINGTSEALASRRGITAYRLRLPAGGRSFHVEYEGLVDLPPTASPEEYARSFAETPGIIEPRGVYLAGSTLWYPQLAGALASDLVTYSLNVNVPPGWHLIAPGNGVSRSADGMAHWESPSAVDEISLAGGPLTLYSATAGRVKDEVYLREADEALADKYLDATARYISMYDQLLGPYPYEKFALVENFWETGYGMPSYTLLGHDVIRFPFILTSSYPHEILHNWWGNSVYVDYATGNWCEGLTAYLADHLMKEIEGEGAEYRRDILKKYRDFASKNGDFPLRDFRSRHSAATEAVGYGKTLMGFHMLRRELGDDVFRKTLATFYKEYRGHRASFADVRAVFEQTSGRDLKRFFEEWVNRTGAADLAVTDVKVHSQNGHYAVTGVIRQRQAGPYELEVPIVVATAKGPVMTTLPTHSAAAPFTVETDSPPQALAVDPEFDLFRILDPRETAPSIGQLFGASEVTAVLPSEPAADADAWRAMLGPWNSPASKVTIVTDRDISAIPADHSVWLLGRQNRFAAKLFASNPTQGLAVTTTGVRIGTKDWPFAGHSEVLTRRHPKDPKLAVGWIAADPAAAIAGLGRKLPHYGKYSWLVFEGAEAANVAKGEWTASDSPLLVNVAKPGAPVSASAFAGLPKRKPLAEPPPTYSAGRLQQHVNYLAAPEREGRGFGSAGLAAAGEYIRKQFVAAGLKPGGDDGGWFQSFTATGGPDAHQAELRNVIGLLPGVDPQFKGEVAVLSAHYDHLGYGWPNPRADAVGKLHPGACDNASGVAVMIEVARQLASHAAPARTIVFIAFSGEEAGLLGSHYYTKHPLPVPLSGVVGDINLDTVCRPGAKPIDILATESAREWPFVFSGISAATGIPTRSIPGAAESSDQESFIEAGVPGVQLYAYQGSDYHRPTDTADKTDGAGMARVATVATVAIDYLASTDKRLTPAGRTGAGPPPRESGPGRSVSLGAIPDFAFQGPGLRLDGVVPGSPAEKAGMRKGDILTSFGGQDVSGLSGFSEILKKYQPGDRVKLKWTRNGEQSEADVELVPR